MADFTEWLINGRTPSAAYREMVGRPMIALDKKPGVRPVGVRETWHRLMVKYILRIIGQEVNDACGTEHLTGEVEAGIEGGIHVMRLLWAHHYQEED